MNVPERFLNIAQDEGQGKFSEWSDHDIIYYLEPIFARGGYRINGRGLIVRREGTMTWHTPWIHVKQATKKRCQMDHHVLFNHMHFIPKRCQECWKVVVGPDTLEELFALLDVEYALNLPSKCGIEVRNYTPRHYGGYFYNNSLDEGRECYETVRKAVDEHIGKHVSVILKRGCTEMELSIGPSPYWKVTPEAERWESYIEDRIIDDGNFEPNQPEYIKAHIFKKWVRWALSNGDQTYKKYTGGKPLFPPPVMYHDGDVETMKDDLARARSHGLCGVEPEKFDAFFQEVAPIAEKHGINRAAMGTMLGYNEFNPLSIGGEAEQVWEQKGVDG